MLLCSCGQGADIPKQTGQPQQTSAATAKDGGTLNICAMRPDTFNPLFTKFSENREVLSLVFDPLVNIGADFKPVPALAESWTVSEQGKKLSLKLREGVTWHDGGDFTADDVIYTFSELQNSKNVSVYKDRLTNVGNVKKTDSYNVDITLRNPQAGFVSLLDFPIIKKGTPPGSGRIASDILPGTGRYKISGYTQLKGFTLSVNPAWWGAEKPHIPTVNVVILPDHDSVFYSFNSGIIDAAAVSSSDMSKFSLRDNTAFATIPTNNYYFISMNMASLLFSDKTVRKAIYTAIDQDRLVSEVLMGFAVPASQPVNPGAWVSSPRKDKKGAQLTRQLLEGSGWSISDNNGIYEKKVDKRTVRLSFDLIVNEENGQKCSIADFVAKELSQCGIKVNVKRVSFENEQKQISSGSFDAFIGSVRLSADYNLSMLFGSGGSLNFGHFSSHDLDKAIEDVNSAETQDAYSSAFSQLLSAFNEELPHIPLAFEAERMIYDSAKLGGISTLGFTSYYDSVQKWFVK